VAPNTTTPGSRRRRGLKHDCPGLRTTAPSTMSPGSSQRRRPKHDDPGLETTASPQARRPLARHRGAQDNAVVSSTTPGSRRRRCPMYDGRWHDLAGLKTMASPQTRPQPQYDCIVPSTTVPSPGRRPLARCPWAQDDGVAPNTTALSSNNSVVPSTMSPSTTFPGSRQRRRPKHDDLELNTTALPRARHPWARDDGFAPNTTALSTTSPGGWRGRRGMGVGV
jgi:hypothetical protein